MSPHIHEHLPHVDLRLEVGLGPNELWHLVVQVVLDQHVEIARSGPDHMVCRVLHHGAEAGEFVIRWAPAAAGTLRVRTALVTHLLPRSKLPWMRRRLEATTTQTYRIAMERLDRALRRHQVLPPEPVRTPLIDPELARRAALVLAPPPLPESAAPVVPDVGQPADDRARAATIDLTHPESVALN